MSSLINRFLDLKNELQEFPLGNCSPSDDPDMQTQYIFSYREIVKRFVATAKRIDDEKLHQMLSAINTSPEYITEAYDLKAEMVGIIDYIDDSIKDSKIGLKEKTELSSELSNSLINIIRDSLYTESANYLPTICSGFGLREGTVEEANTGKKNYVYSRIMNFNSSELINLARKLQGKYPDSGLKEILSKIDGFDNLSLEAKFDNIKKRIIEEIRAAKFIIWLAVAWFTDPDLANELHRKSRQGINIQIIINDDEINSYLGKKFDDYFENYKLSSDLKSKGIMHHKFCVIDMKKVIHGSYNWTNKAQYNNETISIVEGREIAEKFAAEFIQIKEQIIKSKKRIKG